jgi:sugar/nucleoside kinase (ribokinase family)
MRDFITFGSATRDVFLRSPAFETHPSEHSATGVDCCFPLGAKIEISELVFETGGGATNAAVTFGRLGHSVATVSCIGDDLSGSDIREVLEANGVDCSLIQTDTREQTAFSLITLVGGGERTIMVYRGAAGHISSEAIPWSKIKAKWFYVTSLAGKMDLMDEILQRAEACGAKVAWNPGSRELRLGLHKLAPFIERVDVLNMNFEEGMHLVGMTARNLKSLFSIIGGLPRQALVITDGLAGAYAHDGQKAWHSGVLDVPRVNVTGAGDAFGSGFVAGLHHQNDLTYALKVGTLNATGVVQITGAKHGILAAYPDEADLDRVSVTEWEG